MDENILKKKQERTSEIMKEMIKRHVAELGPDLNQNVKVLESFFHKSNLELDSLHVELAKELDKSK